MRLYLVRHGEATSDLEDPRRPLSAVGRAGVEKVAQAARRALARPQQVFHSGKLRAVETAEILAAHLGPGEPPRKIAGLNPNDDPAVAAELAAHIESDTMLVGHLPHLSCLASLLLCGNPNRELVRFPAAALLCLERTGPHGGWVVSWMITPEAL